MRPTLIRRAGMPNFPGLYRANHVPKWQRLHQTEDGLRQWQKGPRANFMLYPYYVLLTATVTTSLYGMVRMVFGHKTFFGKE